jgi:hypothetical protein
VVPALSLFLGRAVYHYGQGGCGEEQCCDDGVGVPDAEAVGDEAEGWGDEEGRAADGQRETRGGEVYDPGRRAGRKGGAQRIEVAYT